MNENIVKICKIHGPLVKDQVKIEKTRKNSETLRCHLCKIDKDRKWKDNHRDQHNKASIRWKKNNRSRVNEWNREDRKKNPEKHREWSRIGRERIGILRSIKDVTRIRGITLEQYYQLVGSQNNRCAICNNYETRKNRMGNIARLAIDHNHKTNEVRALLCHGCNTGIGKFKESIDLMQKAIEYLKKHNTKDGLTLEKENAK